MSRIMQYFDKLPERLQDPTESKKIIRFRTYLCLAIISLIMTIVNVFSDVGVLTIVTGVFSILCVANIVLSYICNAKFRIVVSTVFSVEILVLFTFFVLTGNPHGFSPIWVVLLPGMSMLFYGKKYGAVLSGTMLLILVFFLWTPFGKDLLFDEAKEYYTETFYIRFPLLYLSDSILAYLIKSIEDVSFSTSKRYANLYKDLMEHDVLTGIYNRFGLNHCVEEIQKSGQKISFGVGILDIDHFKMINDVHGHNAGDYILKEFSRMFQARFPTMKICRWGGDEFVFLFNRDEISEEQIEQFVVDIFQHAFVFSSEKTIYATISMGIHYAVDNNLDNLQTWIRIADNALYESKRKGRNCLTIN